jgi:hypothetical protein
VLVDQVQGVPGELGATTSVAANQISILVTYDATAVSHGLVQKFEEAENKDVRVICQIRSLEMLARWTDMVTGMLDSVELDRESPSGGGRGRLV